MITNLREVSLDNSSIYGQEIVLLKKIIDHGIYIADSIIISNIIFKKYLDNKYIDNKDVEDILRLRNIQTNNINDSIFIKTSSFQENIGVIKNSHTNCTIDLLKTTIQSIYNSWMGNKAKSYRITYSLKEELTYPSLIIQPFFNRFHSLVTRCPKTGIETNDRNILNIHNTINKLQPLHKCFIRKIESIANYPVKIFFTEKDNVVCIFGVHPETLTNHAKWVALNDLFTKGSINGIELLTQIEPNMISKYEDIEICPSEGTTLFGINAAPGRVEGRLITSDSNTSQNLTADSNYIVFFESNYHSRDIDILSSSSGAISCVDEGMTSHLAVIGRGMNIPVVTGITNLKVNSITKKFTVNDIDFNEGCYIFVDGHNGNVTLSEKPLKYGFEQRYSTTLSLSYLSRLYSILDEYTSNFDVFGRLPIDTQYHLSILKSRFNKIIFKPSDDYK